MRSFVRAVLTGEALSADPPLDLVRTNHLGPIAYRMGVAALRGEYAASAIAADRRLALIRQLARAFGGHGVEIALIKGSSLVGTIYPDPAERPMHDIDVLVRTDRLPEAIRCIKDMGFARVGFSRKLSRWYHAVVFMRGDMMVELHRNIVQPYRTNIQIEDMWGRSMLDPQGSGAQRLDPVDDLLICMVHMARHELAVPALNYVDVSRLWNRLDTSERALLFSRARAYRIERTVAAVLGMSELLKAGARGTPGEGRFASIYPTTDDVLRGNRPARLRQIAQKLLLAEGMRERLGLGFVYGAAILDGWWQARSEHQR
ncbi:MAG: nucleotidyltransferase family protein [Deltaproteobacteria bacterium]|nr:nucleotidyltransferase family protein [Deltaproteobacteria bacterium]